MLPPLRTDYRPMRRPSEAGGPSRAETVSPLSLQLSSPRSFVRTGWQVRRKKVGSGPQNRRPVSPVSDVSDDGDTEAIQAAAAAGVPFLYLRDPAVENENANLPSQSSTPSTGWGTPGRRLSRASAGPGRSGGGENTGASGSRYLGTLTEEMRDRRGGEGGGERRAVVDARITRENRATAESGWRPGYLRRRVVASFVAGFGALIITIEVLCAADRANDGLREGRKGISVFWGYLPTIILTLVAALWGRLEFQAKRYIPWILLSGQSSLLPPSPDASDSLLLDYTNISLPKALLTAIRKKHLLVLAPMLTSLLLLVEIVLSTGIFVVQDTLVRTDGSPAILRDRFVLDYDDANPPFKRESDRDPYAVMLGIETANLSYPDGYMPGVAYRTFELPGTGGDESFRMAVDTVSVRPDCEISVVGGMDTGTNLTANSSICGGDIPVVLNLRSDKGSATGDQYHFVYEDLDRRGSCSGKESLVLAGVFQMRRDSNGSLEHVKSAAVVCKVPFYSGTRDVELRPDAGYTVLPSTAGDDKLVERSFLDPIHYSMGYNGTFAPVATGNYFMTDDLPPPFVLAAHRVTSGLLPVNYFLDRGALRDGMEGALADFGALAAHYKLREGSANLSTGTAIAVGRRLRVVSGIAHAMAALFGVALLLTAPLVLYVPRRGITPRNPNSVSGTATLLVGSRDIFGILRGADTSDLGVIAERLRGMYYSTVETAGPSSRKFVVKKRAEMPSTASSSSSASPAPSPKRAANGYNPWVLGPVFRVVSIVLAGAFAATLWGLVSASNSNHGLGNVSDPYDKAILWTCLPAAVLVALAAYIRAVDYQTRFLAPFSSLYRADMFADGMTTTYTDELAPVTVYKAVRGRNWAVVLAKGAAVAAALMPILVCRLFTPEATTGTTRVELRQAEWFVGTAGNASLIGDLAENNVSYPWTHGDLVFPQFEVVGDTAREESTVIQTRLGAVRAELTCEPLKPADDDLATVECQLLDRSRSTMCGNGTAGRANEFFGHVATVCTSTSTGEDFPAFIHYIWGSCDAGVPDYRAIVSCYEKVVEVEVDATLRGPSLRLVAAEADTSTSRESEVTLPEGNPYKIVGGTDDNNPWYDAFFALVSQTTTLGADTTLDSVTSAIQTRHSLLRAQTLASLRAPSTGAPRVGMRTQRAERVVQNAAPTYLLAVLLTLVVGFSAASVVTAPKRELPCSPGSVAAVAGMLAEWGPGVVPEGAEWMSDGEIRRYFEAAA
ncbi:uncharacterized protein DNG_08606 [Cephalotrichum gorgonifer]|uniref:Uncharacterized protein n=1 Tax=Cephalotrichum gorgonifer TaxID=2041049 RepID=A0AAE8N4L7_9PEZI|nr:uncharacterized protein DNG_08606 [Cephalotrichum gorgonifer]